MTKKIFKAFRSELAKLVKRQVGLKKRVGWWLAYVKKTDAPRILTSSENRAWTYRSWGTKLFSVSRVKIKKS